MNALAPFLGVLAGLAGIADTIPYVRDTVRGSTRPHRGVAAGAVEQPNLSMLLYPAYYCLVNAVTAILIHRRRGMLSIVGVADRREPSPWRESTVPVGSQARSRGVGIT